MPPGTVTNADKVTINHYQTTGTNFSGLIITNRLYDGNGVTAIRFPNRFLVGTNGSAELVWGTNRIVSIPDFYMAANGDVVGDFVVHGGARAEAGYQGNTNGFTEIITVGTNSPLIRTNILATKTNTYVYNPIGDGSGLTNLTLPTADFASMTISTGAVTSASSAGPNMISGWAYRVSSGNIGIVTNALWATNAGWYTVSYGSSLLAGNSDTAGLLVYTNGVAWPHISLTTTFGASAVAETGFKEAIMELPANTTVSLQTTNSDTSAQVIANTCLNMRRIK